MTDTHTWDAQLPKRRFRRDFSIKLNEKSERSHKVTVTFESISDKAVAIAEALLGKRVINVQNAARLPSGQTEEEFARKLKVIEGTVYPLVPTGGPVHREPTEEEAVDVLLRAINNGTLTADNCSPEMVVKLKAAGIKI